MKNNMQEENMKKLKEKKCFTILTVLLPIMVVLMALPVQKVQARRDDKTILDGVYVDQIDLSGMTVEEANNTVNAFVDELKQRVVTFGAVDEHYVAITVGDLNLTWTNPEVLEEAVSLGKEGNIVQRYKSVQDLKHGKKVYPLTISVDKDIIRTVMLEQCAEYDVPAVNVSLRREGKGFTVIEGQTGLSTNIEETINKTYDYLTKDWDYQDASIDVVVDVTQPKGNAQELAVVKDVLGSFTTSYSTSGKARRANVENGVRLINGTTLYPGEEFSTYQTVRPFTESNGYYPAGSYLNGKVVDSIGGGICQVSTTLYNAVLLSELEITERHNHSMIVSYVEPSMDAAIAESAGKDFKFKNNLNHPIYIEGITADRKVTFTIYGLEERNQGHKVKYESEVLKVTQPDRETIVSDAGMPVGSVVVESAHIGYVAQLWRIIEENGQEISREVINKSNYKVSPRSATVGTATDNPVHAQRIQAAIATGSIDNVKAEAGAIKAEMAAVAAQQQEIAKQQAELEAYYKALAEQEAAEGVAAP